MMNTETSIISCTEEQSLPTVELTSTTATPTTDYTSPTPPPNPTWIIVGSIAGGLVAIGLLVIVTGIYICYSKSRKNLRIQNKPSNDPNSMELRRVAY
ncbi:unnamed protein product [Rotaria sordida]|uniref:Uncharacterized protein n=1 Tax=Rotaria sordida TaxID=392033 RepID=A0A818QDJ1_9BILA|nr:unnamed protein product [Rotaria sordida]CAF3633302.1 unnamed protein product [Rotaria sordida]